MRQQQQWFELLTELLESGFSLREAVEFSETLYPQWRVPLHKIRNLLSNGNSFADSMAEWVSIDTYYQLLLAERHGQILATLRHFNQYLKVRTEQIKKLRHLLEYPLLLLGMLGGVITMIVIFLLPQLNSFTGDHQQVVWGRMCQPLGIMIGGCTAMIIFRYWHYRRLRKIDQVRVLCSLPIFGGICRYYYGYYLCTNLAFLLEEGLSLQRIIAMCEDFRSDAFLYQLSQKLKKLSAEGKNVSQLIRRECFIPDELGILIQQGTQRDKLARQVSSLADQLFKRLMIKCEHELTMVQPILYLVIAGIIVGLYLQILMPVYQNLQVIK